MKGDPNGKRWHVAYFWIFVAAYALSLITAYHQLSAHLFLGAEHVRDRYRRRAATPDALVQFTFKLGTAMGLAGSAVVWLLTH